MDDEVIRAIADPGRRALLDELRAGGRTVSELEAVLPRLGRHAVLKHLGVLEAAGLITTRKTGRQRHCHLNAVPLVALARRWLDDYSFSTGSALLSLRDTAEGRTAPMAAPMTAPMTENRPDHVSTVVVAAPAATVWAALTDPGQTRRWYYACRLQSDLVAGSAYAYRGEDGREHITGTVEVCEPPTLLEMTFAAHWDDEIDAEPASRVRWELTPEGEAGALTRVTVVHTGLAGSPATTAAVTRGWPFLLSNLKTLVESGAPMPA